MLSSVKSNTFIAITQQGVQLALAEADTPNLIREDTVPVHDDITPAMLISSGLEFESQQYVFSPI